MSYIIHFPIKYKALEKSSKNVRIYRQTNSNHFPNSSNSSSWRWRTALNWGESVSALSNVRSSGLMFMVEDMGEGLEGLELVIGGWIAGTGSSEGA